MSQNQLYRVTHLLANLGWVEFGMFHHPAWAVGSYSSGHQPGELPKSKSTQPRFATRWVTLYNLLDHPVPPLLSLFLVSAHVFQGIISMAVFLIVIVIAEQPRIPKRDDLQAWALMLHTEQN